MIAFDEDPVQKFHRIVRAERNVTPKDIYELWCKSQKNPEEGEEISGVRKKDVDNISDYTG